MDQNKTSDTRSSYLSFDGALNVSDASHSSASAQEQSIVFIDRPKRALTSYNIYFQYKRQEMLKLQNIIGKRVGFAAMARTVAAMWKQVDEEEKKFYATLAEQDKTRHARETIAWKRAKKAAEGIDSSNNVGDGRNKKGSKVTSQRTSNNILEFPNQQGVQRISGTTTSLASSSPQYDQLRQQDDSFLPPYQMPVVPKDTGITAALRRKQFTPSQPKVSFGYLAAQPTAADGLASQLMQEKNLQPYFDTDSVMPQVPLTQSCVPLSSTFGLGTFVQPACSQMQPSQSLWNSTEVSDCQSKLPPLHYDADPFSNCLSEEAPISHQDFSEVLQQDNVSSFGVMDELAERMGPDCSDLFLDMFRS